MGGVQSKSVCVWGYYSLTLGGGLQSKRGQGGGYNYSLKVGGGVQSKSVCGGYSLTLGGPGGVQSNRWGGGYSPPPQIPGPGSGFCLVSVLPHGGGGVGGWVWQNFRVGGCPTSPPPPGVGWDFVGALGSIEPVPLLSFFCCRFRVTCLFMVCLHVIAYHVCMPHAHKGARMLLLCWM